MSSYWLKLHYKLMERPEVGRLSDSAFRTLINCMIIAGKTDKRDGSLPDLDDLSWTLRISIDQVNSNYGELERAGLMSMVDGKPFLNEFTKSQARLTNAEKQRLYRERVNNNSVPADSVTESNATGNDVVTGGLRGGYVDKDKDKDIEVDKEQIKKKSKDKDKLSVKVYNDWVSLFPAKPSHRDKKRNALIGKASTRLKDSHFKEKYLDALVIASQNQYLCEQNWFNLDYFLRNDENYRKILDGVFDGFVKKQEKVTKW